jgi:nucleoside-diphosphate-sugar epimerase
MKLLITGALGHIGSRFIHDLRPGEFSEVVLVDNLTTLRYCSLFNLPAGVPFRFVEADVRAADLDKLFAGMEVVMHLAAITDATRSFENEAQVEQVNFVGTERVAQACVKTGCRLIFPSSTSVYGVQEGVVDEDCPIDQLKPQSPYADNKLRAERLLAELGASANLRFIICRFGTIYGVSPGMRFHTAVNKFAWQACLGEPVTVWRTALHQRRPYLDLGDAVRALRFILQRDLFDQRIYNVLTDNLTVAEVLEALRELTPGLEIKFVDSPIMNQLSYTVRNDRFRALGFEFQGQLREVLNKTVSLLKNIGSR